jgi:hypothetical protein
MSTLSPEEIQYQMSHQNEDRAADIVVSISVMLAVAYVSVLLRVVARRMGGAQLKADDWMIMVGLVRIFEGIRPPTLRTLTFRFQPIRFLPRLSLSVVSSVSSKSQNHIVPEISGIDHNIRRFSGNGKACDSPDKADPVREGRPDDRGPVYSCINLDQIQHSIAIPTAISSTEVSQLDIDQRRHLPCGVRPRPDVECHHSMHARAGPVGPSGLSKCPL